MNKEEFISTLKSENPANDSKLDCLQYFIDNYPVQIKSSFNLFTMQVGYTWTSLPDYKVKDDTIAMKNLDVNFNKLQQRLEEITNFK